MKKIVIDCIKENKIIAILRKVETQYIIQTAKALRDGGIRMAEVTFDQSGAITNEETAEQIAMLSSHFGETMRIGAGTVMNTAQVEAAYHAGAKYIISPNTDEAVIKKTAELSMVSIPGAVTPSEMEQAAKWGADFVKMFPAGELGLGYIKAILAPMNHIKTLAVGGINENNLKDFLNAGVLGVGIGSNIVKNQLIHQGNFDGITKLAKKYTVQI